MFFRDVLKRWSERPVGATDDRTVPTACRVAPSLLEELAADAEDFADLAAILHLDLAAVRAALLRERLRTPVELFERLAPRASSMAVGNAQSTGDGTVMSDRRQQHPRVDPFTGDHGRPQTSAADRKNRTLANILFGGPTMRAKSIWQRRLAAAVAVALIVTGPGVSFAGSAPRGSTDDRLRALEAEIEQLKRERAQQAEEKPVTEPDVKNIVDEAFKKQKVLAGWQDGFFLQSPGGDFKLKLRGYVQADGRFFADDDGDTGNATFTMRRVRPIFEGTVYKYFGFRIMPDFGGGNTVLQDAYGEITYFPWAQLRAGKFKPPVSLERLQSGADLTFIERSILQNLVPNRDVGVQLAGDFLDGTFGYQVGIFNGVFDTEAGRDVDLTDDKDFAGRVFSHPFRGLNIAALNNFGFGLAGTIGHANGESLSGLAYKTAGRSNYFTYNADAKVVSRGDHWRVNPQLYYYFGPFGLMGEYAVSKQTVEGTAGGAARADYDATGWYLQASYVLTGEDSTYKSVTPINNFDPRQGRWGAFEIAARVANTNVDNDPFGTKVTTFTLAKGTTDAMAYTAGLNWYLNKSFKFQFNYERTDFAGAPSFSGKPKTHEDAVLGRFQVSF